MSTDAQINANRQNAQKSTGPVTPEGKAIVSQNALKHGLFAVQDVVPTENQAEFDSMREQMLADLAPVGAMETLLAQRAFSLAWRLQRAATMQAQVTQDMVESHISTKQWRLGRRQPKDTWEIPDYLALGRIAKEDWCSSKLIERLFEYERRIEKSLYKTIAQLQAMKAARLTAQADAAEMQHPAQAEEKTNSEKQSQISEAAGNPKHETRNLKRQEQNFAEQSQSDETESTEGSPDRFAKWPDTYGIDPKELTAFLKKTYGDRYPEMVKAILNRHNGSPAKAQATSGSQAESEGSEKNLPLSLLKS